MCWFFYNTDGLLAEDCLRLYRKGSAAVKVVSVTQWAQVQNQKVVQTTKLEFLTCDQKSWGWWQ